ncbi:MAG: TrkA C-terminal domain-containing protein [Eubacteriales bacterium]|jgi:K+/H+ antiporter YhaU regulatory subunit KhtT|nr:TrkA C-terminal domain-containing protein [Eubacteriales bacterium]
MNKKDSIKNISSMAKYEKIAFDIATKILKREYTEGQKLYGRSTLAGRYNVSPETIRRAVALLQSMGIVEVFQGSGINVKDRNAAKKYVESFNHRQDLLAAREKYLQLLDEKRELDKKIEEQMDRVLMYSSRLLSILPRVGEIVIEKNSPLINKSLIDLQFRKETDATVIAIERKGEEIFSPNKDFVLQEGDCLIFIASSEKTEKIEKYVNSQIL